MPPLPPALRLLPRLFLVLGLVAATGCTSTRFPETPEAHPLFVQVQAAGPYYANVRAGMKSRVLGLMPEPLMRATLSAVEARWAEIDALAAPDALATYFRQHGLTPVADALDDTLRLNADDAPAGGAAPGLTAAAVKLGLLDAFAEAER